MNTKIRFAVIDGSLWFSLNDIPAYVCELINEMGEVSNDSIMVNISMNHTTNNYLKQEASEQIVQIRPKDGFVHYSKVEAYEYEGEVKNSTDEKVKKMMELLVKAAKTNDKEQIKSDYPEIWESLVEVKLVQITDQSEAWELIMNSEHSFGDGKLLAE